jgi:2-C-methyl-D-erythritol 4-phosphate cytidylyltransferase/2-C-methyl-D-erythritol 4-phosphate cytidylyltransferase/2-C-methyl-D-erythritol 2,4-cyclodiphosphate synthase
MPATVPCHALVPCAGVGARSGAAGPKQYVAVAGRSMVEHTLLALLDVERLHGVTVVLAPDDRQFEDHVHLRSPRLHLARCGGATRADTVAAGLAALRDGGAGDDDWVLVHDAARCLLRPAWVDALIDACADDAVGGLLALPLADTLKQAGPDAGEAPAAGARVLATVDRADKWQAQTPQMFRLGLLSRALAQAGAAGRAVTDESSAVEALGLAPRLVAGSSENFKLTYPADFDLAERLLRTR